MEPITMKIEKEIGVLSKNERGYTKEVNLISWNGQPAKLDVREWYPGHERCGKGITLTIPEGEELVKRLQDFYYMTPEDPDGFMPIPQGSPFDPPDHEE